MNIEKLNKTQSRRRFFKESLAASARMVALSTTPVLASTSIVESKIWITDLRCAVIKGHVVLRILTNIGVNGYAMAEFTKPYLKPFVMFYKDYVVGMDPTDVSPVIMKIRRMGRFKPWGAPG